jgi:subtilase family serine protease
MKLTLFWWFFLAATILSLNCARALAQIAIPTARIILKGNHPALVDHLTSAGATDPQMPLRMRLRLAVQNRTTLDRLVSDQQDPTSPRYHQWLTSAEFDAQFGPSQAQIEEVAAWLTSQNFHVTATSIPFRIITFTGTSSQVQQAFQTSLKTFAGGSSYAKCH